MVVRPGFGVRVDRYCACPPGRVVIINIVGKKDVGFWVTYSFCAPTRAKFIAAARDIPEFLC